MAKTVFQVLAEQLNNEKARISDHLMSGSIKDFAEYRELVGVNRGLTAAMMLIQDLSRNMENDDD